jgi:hypothetical protein
VSEEISPGAGGTEAWANDDRSVRGPIARMNSPRPDLVQGRIDPRLAFLACASARYFLVDQGEMSVDQAVDAPFVDQFRKIAGLTCWCEYETMQRMEAVHRRMRRHRQVSAP